MCLLPSFCTHPQRDGQAELTWVACYISKWFIHPQTVTNPSTNHALVSGPMYTDYSNYVEQDQCTKEKCTKENCQLYTVCKNL